MIVAFQLALTGVHELSESQWLPSSKQEMALIGPVVRHELFFFVLTLGVAAILVLREILAGAKSAEPPAAANPAEKRRLEWEQRKQRRWMVLASAMCLLVVLALTADFVYTQAAAAPPDAKMVTPQGQRVLLPLSELGDSKLHFYSVEAQGRVVRFLVIRKPEGGFATALDACLICGPVGYYQDGQNVICRNCSAPIYIPSIGEVGGCNPIGFSSHTEDGNLVFDLASINAATQKGRE
jgi:high-affinity iron transporter